MGRGNPQVISGSRGPREMEHVRPPVDRVTDAVLHALESGKKLKKKVKEIDPNDPYSIVFQSRFPGLIVQLTVPKERTDPATGEKIISRPVKAKFEDGVYRVPKRYDLEEAEDIIRRLRKHANYSKGPGGFFWEQADAIKKAKKKRITDLIEAIKSDPELAREAGLALSAKDDHEDVGDRGPTDRVKKRKLRAAEEEEEEEAPRKKKKKIRRELNSSAPRPAKSDPLRERHFAEDEEEESDEDQEDDE